MIVGYDIGGGGLRLFDGEHLRVDDDGAFELWRLTESPVVGRFAGRLDAATRANLAALAEHVAGGVSAGGVSAGGVSAANPLPPGGHGERWLASDAVLDVAAGRTPEGPWGALLEATRALIPSLSEHPVAALELVVADDWTAATLHQRGSEGLAIDPAGISVEVAAWKGYYDLVGTWKAAPGEVPPLGQGAGAPGWSLTIPLDHKFRPGPGRVLHVKVGVEVAANDGRTRLVATVAPEMVDPGA